MRLRDLHRDRLVWLFGLIVLAFFYKPLTTETFYFRDIYHLFYPAKQYLEHAGPLPLWDALRNGGKPYATMPPNFAFHPSNVLYLVLPSIVAFNLVLVLHVLFCAIAAYWLARVLRLSPAAAFVAGSAFAFCGYTLSTANLTPALIGLPWVPMALGLTHRALRDKRSLAPAAVAVAMPLYSAAAELTGLLAVTLIVWVLCARAGVSRRTRVLALVVVIGGGGALSLMQTLPATSVIAQSSRGAKRTYEGFSSWSVHPKRLPELIAPQYLGDTGSLDERRYHGHELESLGFPYILSIYLGAPLLVLALLGAQARAREVPAWALLSIALFGLVLSLGRRLPFFHAIYDYVPLVTIFRYPIKAQMIALLPVALLAAYGVDQLANAKRLAITAALSVAAIGVIVALTSGDEFVVRSFVHCAIACTLFAIATVRVAWIPAVVLLDLLVAGYPVNRYAPRSLYDEPPIAGVVRRMVGDGRFWAASRKLRVEAPNDDRVWLARQQMETLEGYTGALYGIRVIYHDDYDGLAQLRIAKLSKLIERLPWNKRKRVLELSGVRAVITPDLKLVALGPAPMARFVSRVQTATKEIDALNHFVNGRDVIETANASTAGALRDCGSADVRKMGNRYEVNAPCRGFVIFAEPHYDGWHATVDGREVAHVRANYAFTAVPVEQGRHVIERTYRPPLLLAGVLATIAAAGLLVFAGRVTS